MCGILGVIANSENKGLEREVTNSVMNIFLPGIVYIERRGYDAIGWGLMNSTHGEIICERYAKKKPSGSQFLDEVDLDDLVDKYKLRNGKDMGFSINADMAFAQSKYITSHTDGENGWDEDEIKNNTQPIKIDRGDGKRIIFLHNGNIEYLDHLKSLVKEPSNNKAQVDSRWLAEYLMSLLIKHGNEWDAAKEMMEELADDPFGAVVWSDGKSMYAMKDPKGVKPLCLGMYQYDGIDCHVICSESGFFDDVDIIRFIREIEPGEILKIDSSGRIENRVLVTDNPAPCLFEPIYFMDHYSRWGGEFVAEIRERVAGKMYERYCKVVEKADLLLPVPNSGNSFLHGLAHASGKLGPDSMRKPEKKRYFLIQEGHKYSICGRVEGKNILLADDSLMRGQTIVKIYHQLNEKGALDVDLLVGWPLNVYGCNNGIDTKKEEDLVGNILLRGGHITAEEIASGSYDINRVNLLATDIVRGMIKKTYGSDYPTRLNVHYPTLHDLRDCFPGKNFCNYCHTGNRP